MSRPIRSLTQPQPSPLAQAQADVLAAKAELEAALLRLTDAAARLEERQHAPVPVTHAYLDVGQIASETSLSRRQVYRDVQAGLLPALRRGRRVLVRRADLDAYLDTLRESA